MKQVDLQGNVYDIGIEAKGFSDKALEQIVEVIRPFLNEKDKEIERLNNDIKELLKENENKEKVILAQDNIIKEVRELLNQDKASASFNTAERNALEILDKEVKSNE